MRLMYQTSVVLLHTSIVQGKSEATTTIQLTLASSNGLT